MASNLRYIGKYSTNKTSEKSRDDATNNSQEKQAVDTSNRNTRGSEADQPALWLDTPGTYDRDNMAGLYSLRPTVSESSYISRESRDTSVIRGAQDLFNTEF